jgi:ankyrin repeat protein
MSAQSQSPETLLAAALEISGTAERRAYLDRACAEDAALRTELESLLAAHERATGFMNTPALPVTAPPVPAEKAGDHIGRYKLLEQIGEGGFGVVWMAEQEEPVRRRVALKIIKLGMDTKEVVARFEAERQALAMMDHPHIASVFDGGATDTGRPYFVMELVKGVPITHYCDVNKLSTRERLELFMQVCQAVQHAHQKGVIHRDLKPSNILVTVKDDRPVPKVIDFGVAKATQARLTEKTLFTRFQQWIGTPAYMSPEQAGLGSLDVDTRSDIYSLGVLLYELLTGHTPFDTQKLLAAGYDAVMRTIREEEPPKPSTRLSTLAERELATVATRRGAEPATLGRSVRGDLDWIAMRALEKDRTRRYETASDFARDIERHLRSEPVWAAAPGVVYRAQKFVRRHRSRFVVAGLAALILGLAAVGVKLGLKNQSSHHTLQTMGTNAIFNAAKSGDAAALRRLLDANPQLANQRDAGGSTPLAYAAEAGMTNTLHLLLARNAVVDATNSLGQTPLMAAAHKGRAAAVAVLLEAGADPNYAGNQGETALFRAADFGATEAARLLLAKGARVDALHTTWNATPLHLAAMFGYADFVELLLTHGARTDLKDANGSTPLHVVATGQSTADAVLAWERRFQALASQVTGNPAATNTSNQLTTFGATLPTDALRGGQHRRVVELLLARRANLEVTDAFGRTPLLTAALFTNLPVAEVLVGHKANVNARAKDGSPPLNLAALKGSVPLVELLLKAGANANLQDDTGFTPLNTAAEHGHTEVMRRLLAHGANPNLACPGDQASTVNGQAPMHSAAIRGDVEMLRLLLDQGALLNLQSKAGTPLCWAVKGEHTPAVELLLQRGALPDLPSSDQDMTPLHWAAILGQPDLVALLLKHGASNNIPSGVGRPLHAAVMSQEGVRRWLAPGIASGKNPYQPRVGSDEEHVAVLKLLLASGADFNGRDLTQRTPLIVAVSQGNVGAVETLLAAGADLEAAEQIGFTALQAASNLDAPAQVVSNVVTRLIRAGASLESRDAVRRTPLHQAAYDGKPVVTALLLAAGARIDAVGPDLRTPLQLAVVRGSREVVALLLAKGADTEWRDSFGCTALHYAVEVRARDLVKLLLGHGADVNAPTTRGSSIGATALMGSAHAGDLEIMKVLLDLGAQIEQADQHGFTALMVAAGDGQVDAAKLLLERGAKLEAADQEGTTVFLRAAKSGQLEMVKFLLERGAKPDACDKVGFTALHEAADRGYAEVAEFLISRGAEVNARSDYPSTPLYNAANGAFTNEARYVAVTKVLLAHGADVNARLRGNQTPLHRAAIWGHPQILQVLLAAGADPTARDDDGKTALDLATATDWPGAPAATRGRPLPPAVGIGRKECAELLRSSRQKKPGNALSPKTSQNTNAPPEKVQDNRRAAADPETLNTPEAKADGQALAELRTRAEQGDAKAQDELGEAFRLGRLGVATNQVEVVKWFRKAADQGNATAQHCLGVMYQRGEGVTKDLAEALKWYRMAAEQGDSGAQRDLGRRFAEGNGVPANNVNAYMWFDLAARHLQDTVNRSARLESQMTPERIAEAKRLSAQFVPRKAPPPHDPPW